jgi:hypothetical protein
MRDSDIPDDAFTTEKMEEANLVMGPQSSLSTAWRVNEHLQELAYTQLWWVVSVGFYFFSMGFVRICAQFGLSALASVSCGLGQCQWQCT